MASLSNNDDGTFNRMEWKSFFNGLTEYKTKLENIMTNDLKVKISNASNFSEKCQLCINKNETPPHISGHCAKKLAKNNLNNCDKCFDLFTHGKNMSDDKMMMLECNTKFMQLRNTGGLFWSNMLC